MDHQDRERTVNRGAYYFPLLMLAVYGLLTTVTQLPADDAAPAGADDAAGAFVVVTYKTVVGPDADHGQAVYKIKEVLMPDKNTPKEAIGAEVAVPWESHYETFGGGLTDDAAAPGFPCTILCEVEWQKTIEVNKEHCFCGLKVVYLAIVPNLDAQLLRETTSIPALRKLRKAADTKAYLHEMADLIKEPGSMSALILDDILKRFDCSGPPFSDALNLEAVQDCGTLLNSDALPTDLEQQVVNILFRQWTMCAGKPLLEARLKVIAAYLKRIASAPDKHFDSAAAAMQAANGDAKRLTGAAYKPAREAYRAALQKLLGGLAALAKTDPKVAQSLDGKRFDDFPYYLGLKQIACAPSRNAGS
ncbi:MAG: hypothetical protein ACREBW_02180 [Candidatus Micrarchaeaceae archaeon]